MKEVSFQLCNEAENPTTKPDKIANIKADGRRVAIIKEGDKVSLWGRDNIVDNSFPEIIEAFKRIKGNFVVDSEFCVFTNQFKTDRGLLQIRDRTKDPFKIRLLTAKYPATAIVFDLLELNNQNLRNEPYEQRKRLLNDLFKRFPNDTSDKPSIIKVTKDWQNPMEAWKFVLNNQLEGIVEKDIHSKYSGKRTDDWIKVKRKGIFKIRFNGYETQNAGITLTNKEGFRCACNGQKHIPVKELFNKQGYVDVWVKALADKTEKGKLREIVFYNYEV